MLWDKLIVYYGLPEKPLSNQDNNFKNNLTRELCQIVEIKYHALLHITHK